MKSSAFLLILLASFGARAVEIDRWPLVQAAHRLFPVFLETLPVEKLPVEERAIVEKVILMAQQPRCSVQANLHPEEFNLTPNQNQRWMKTLIGQPSPIEVNLQWLNRPEFQVSVPFVLKTLFHEYSHKIGVEDWSLRDHVAQIVERQAEHFTRTFPLEGGEIVTVFSIPRAEIDGELAAVPLNRPQPTNLVLIEKEGRVGDITEPLLLALEKASPLVRSLMTEANRMALLALDGMLKIGAGTITKMFRAAGFHSFDMETFFGDMRKPLREVRLLEFLDVNERFFGSA